MEVLPVAFNNPNDAIEHRNAENPENINNASEPLGTAFNAGENVIPPQAIPKDSVELSEEGKEASKKRIKAEKNKQNQAPKKQSVKG